MPSIERSGSNKLAVVLVCFATISSLLLFWADRNTLCATLTLVAIFVLFLYPIFHFAQRGSIRTACVFVLLLLVSLFGWIIWPKNLATRGEAIANPAHSPAAVGSPEQQPISPKRSATSDPSDQQETSSKNVGVPGPRAKQKVSKITITAQPGYNPFSDPIFQAEMGALDAEYENSHPNQPRDEKFKDQKGAWIYTEMMTRDPRFVYAMKYGKRWTAPAHTRGEFVTTGPESIVRGNIVVGSSSDCGVYQYGDNSTAVANKVSCYPKDDTSRTKPQ